MFRTNYDKLVSENVLVDRHDSKQTWKGEPVFMSEYGGIRWSVENKNAVDGWGYGNGPKTLDEFYARYKGLTEALLDNPKMLGFCYTQLTDIEQEQNGVYNYDRTEKFDSKILYGINTKIAAIEK